MLQRYSSGLIRVFRGISVRQADAGNYPEILPDGNVLSPIARSFVVTYVSEKERPSMKNNDKKIVYIVTMNAF
ncbi:hypothetical protein CEXT_423631 [Caerostris extrusa]|uniref:Uncharacterized protein n=1 Tax=Caerostris extrusa TaxID=172846 RepID=A0AAV4T0S4_CAEEX|nr:hypothetical protein CEXT_423631 [Caerostris extrusa]